MARREGAPAAGGGKGAQEGGRAAEAGQEARPVLPHHGTRPKAAGPITTPTQHGATVAAHADWSIDPRKRWVTIAKRRDAVWQVLAAAPVGEVGDFLARLAA